ncbi:uncharacterized protein LOC100275057 [Zea mays]|nr:uncharacterized protein LOC100275057 [Zea mays]|eukprot:XP_008662800.1 uncharacterized protein LOC100275057 isoform X2 [Zea mays]
MLSRSGSTCHKRLHPTIPSIPTHTNTPMTPKSKLPAPHLLLAMAAPCAATAHCTSEPSTPSNLICIRGRYALRRQDCNLVDGEYILVLEQGVAQEVAPDLAPEPAIEDLPAPALEGSLEDMVVGVT